jgi:hypothetical protein
MHTGMHKKAFMSNFEISSVKQISDHAWYWDSLTGDLIIPTWKHIGCGGLVYVDDFKDGFTCIKCGVCGDLEVDIPGNISERCMIKYIYRQVKEVGLTSKRE